MVRDQDETKNLGFSPRLDRGRDLARPRPRRFLEIWFVLVFLLHEITV